MGNNMYNTKQIRGMYDNQLLSTYQIAKILGAKPDTIKHNLMNSGGLRKAPGVDIEEKVLIWLKKKGYTVLAQKGDAPYDLLVDGIKVDVKSAHVCKDRDYFKYQFDIIHKQNKNKDIISKIDELYLVFLDEINKPIYKLATKYISHLKRSLRINRSLISKYPIKLIGYLEI